MLGREGSQVINHHTGLGGLNRDLSTAKVKVQAPGDDLGMGWDGLIVMQVAEVSSLSRKHQFVM